MFHWVHYAVFICLGILYNHLKHYRHGRSFSEQLMVVLYLAAFLTYGLGDSMSAAYMMMVRGTGAELNPILRYIATEGGIRGFIIFKLWATIIILATISFMHIKSMNGMTWTVNCFLLSLTAGGVLATFANVCAASGIPFILSPLDIIMIFTAFIIISITLGELLDNRNQTHNRDKTSNTNEH